MATETKTEESDFSTPQDLGSPDHLTPKSNTKTKSQSRNEDKSSDGGNSVKRRCVSTACIACRKRKSKCDGNTPSCAACSSVYGTECIYDPNSDHRRKGVYKKDIDNLKTRNSTLQTLIQAILNFPENEVPDLVKQIRTCESLDDVAESIIARNNALGADDEDVDGATPEIGTPSVVPRFEKELSGKMGKMRLENGSVSIIGGTSNLIFIGDNGELDDGTSSMDEEPYMRLQQEPATSWTTVTNDAQLVMHLMNMYFTWHYTYFTTLSRDLFWSEFKQGKPAKDAKRRTEHCTELLVNAMLALGCHFTSWSAARAVPDDSATAGDHFFQEAKRLILQNDEHEKPRLATVQALALMSVREAGCGREARGWGYSGMSFRMAYDLGLNIDSGSDNLDESEVDARRITIWGCFLFDKCWSNYLGRQPQIPQSGIAAPKFDVFPTEDAEMWRSYSDGGVEQSNVQPARTRAVALQISQLCEISSDLLLYFYHPHLLEKPLGKQAELKKLSELHTRLEAWRKNLPKEMEPKEGQLPNVLVMHMFFQLLFIHLFRPFLKYKQANSPLPSHVSPRKFITHSAATISKLLRLYRRTYGLRQICNIVVYIAHTACTVHLLNLPDKTAQRDIQHGLNHLEEISEGWICARRTLSILHLVTRRWQIELPEAATKAFMRAEAKYGSIRTPDHELDLKLEERQTISPPMMQAMQPPPPMPQQPSHIPPMSQAPPSFFPPAQPLTQSPNARSQRLPSGESMALPPRSSAELATMPRQQNYVMPGGQQPPTWNNQLPPGTSPQGQPAVSSPTALFGGVHGLMADQEWWLRDSQQFYTNWNSGMDPNANGFNGPRVSSSGPNRPMPGYDFGNIGGPNDGYGNY
ncbi:Nitrogen assimilation transcription factor nit-4 [Bacidia gigantensis]|uniref:Nitrogen assimilation transcription factor nit-4 n=1 Tax=Bacidia gigantensis TaxID=2732470 RepID=UPI001D0422F9|nr:Nitrogen assimilation transcription factor nit-4 [Bacidia gigantensis]KAG8527375.1 Nitrogen assimilation transcription factor nit-4 [Bacidia gigantensis]